MREFSAWLLLATGLVAGISIFGSTAEASSGRYDQAFHWVLLVGASFVSVDAAWVLPTFLGMVLAFYAALLGQSVTSVDRGVRKRTRKRLVPAGMAASVTVLFFGAAAVASAAAGLADWARLPALLTISMAIVLLGLLIGKFEIFSRDERLQNARSQRENAITRLSHLNTLREHLFSGGVETDAMEGHRTVAVTALNIGILLSLLSLLQLLALLLYGLTDTDARKLTFALLPLNILCTSPGFLFPAAILSLTYQTTRSAPRLATAAGRVLPVTFCLPAVAALVAFDSLELSLLVLGAGLLPSALVYATYFALLTGLPGWLRRLSMSYVVFATAHRGARRAVVAADRRIRSLQDPDGGGVSAAEGGVGRMLTSQDESRAARRLGSPVGHLELTNRVQFHGYNWRGSSDPGLPMRQHMVDSIYRVHHEREVVEVSVRSWSGSRGMRALDDSFGFDSLVAVHAMDFLHSASGVPLEEARRLTEQSLGAIDDLADPSTLVVGDVRCEARVAGGAVISLAVRPSNWIFDDLAVELLVASG